MRISDCIDVVCSSVLVDRIRLIDVPGTRQPHWLYGPVASTTQDHAGSDHVGGVRSVRDLLHDAAAQARLSVGGAVHVRRRVLHLPFLNASVIGAGSPWLATGGRVPCADRKSTRLNSSHSCAPRMPSSACKKKNCRPCGDSPL